jgi:hypothetical protein
VGAGPKGRLVQKGLIASTHSSWEWRAYLPSRPSLRLYLLKGDLGTKIKRSPHPASAFASREVGSWLQNPVRRLPASETPSHTRPSYLPATSRYKGSFAGGGGCGERWFEGAAGSKGRLVRRGGWFEGAAGSKGRLVRRGGWSEGAAGSKGRLVRRGGGFEGAAGSKGCEPRELRSVDPQRSARVCGRAWRLRWCAWWVGATG